MKRWKAREYSAASYFGGRRRRQKKYHKQGPDVKTKNAEIEIKTRIRLPKWLIEPLEKTAKWNSQKLPVVIWYQKNMRVEDGVAVLPAKFLRQLLASNFSPALIAQAQAILPLPKMDQSN